MNPPELKEGDRVGRFVMFRDRDGHLVAVAAGAVSGICEIDEGGVLIQFSGKLVHVDQPMVKVLAWLDGRSSERSNPPSVMPSGPPESHPAGRERSAEC